MKEELLDKKENGWKEIDEGRKNEIFDFCNGYMDLDRKSVV